LCRLRIADQTAKQKGATILLDIDFRLVRRFRCVRWPPLKLPVDRRI
jgi:hypothetical protein